MNGSAKYTAPTVLGIQLKRGPQGLGFNIVGGLDQQYVLNDSGIYVAKIKQNGAAALDGRLQEGDKILAINGHKLENLSHSAAVELFRSAGEDVQLRVQQRPTMAMNGPPSSRPDGGSSVSSLGILVAVLGAAAAVTVLFMRFQPQLRRYNTDEIMRTL
uniref:Synaptojanin-2-binding protein n=1 Tax=Oncorhynchus tshawytscha TaxID=74940 RepID=A0AAZ3S8N6_ONCTS